MKPLVTLFAFVLICFATPVLSEKQYCKKTIEHYDVPEVKLLDQNAREIDLRSFMQTDKPLLLDFVYGTCTTICPVLSASFAHFQRTLGDDAESVQLLSISIDPDNDTPELMKEYLQKYGAKTGWDIFTGKRENIIRVLKEFDAYVANKMDHFPLTILRSPGDDEWVRLYGLLSASDLQREYEMLIAK